MPLLQCQLMQILTNGTHWQGRRHRFQLPKGIFRNGPFCKEGIKGQHWRAEVFSASVGRSCGHELSQGSRHSSG